MPELIAGGGAGPAGGFGIVIGKAGSGGLQLGSLLRTLPQLPADEGCAGTCTRSTRPGLPRRPGCRQPT